MRRSPPLLRIVLGLSTLCVLCACDVGRDRLLADLSADRPDQRALAVHKLGEQKRPDDLILFTRAAHDGAAVVREEAAVALGASGAPEVTELLMELAEDPDESVQAKAVAALAHFPGERSRAFLVLQYGRRGRATREVIAQVLQKEGMSDAMARLVQSEAKLLWDRNLKALEAGSLPERATAAETLGQSGRAEAVDKLLPLVKDSQVPLAAGAVRGLGVSGDKRALPALLATLAEPYPELREAALEGVARFLPPEAAAPLTTIAREGGASSLLAVRDLVALPRTDAIDQTLCSLALEVAGDAGRTAAQEMTKRGGCPKAPFLAALKQGSPKARMTNALRALAVLGEDTPAEGSEEPDRLNAQMTAALTALLSARDANVVRLAVVARAAYRGPEGAAALLALYESEWKKLSAARADWIAEPLSSERNPRFDPQPRIIRDATAAVPGNHGPDQRFSTLMQKLDDLDARRHGTVGGTGLPEVVEEIDPTSAAVAAATIQGLGRLGATEALPLVQRHIRDRDPLLREAALIAAPHLGPEGVALGAAELRSAPQDLVQPLAAELTASGDLGRQAVVEAVTNAPAGRAIGLLQGLDRGGATAAVSPALAGIVRQGGPEAVLAARLLGTMRSKSAVPALLESLKDPESVSRREVLWALGQIGDRSVAPQVGKDLSHETPEIRAAAAQALISLGATPEQRSMLEALREDYYRVVREQARAALAAGTGGSPGTKSSGMP